MDIDTERGHTSPYTVGRVGRKVVAGGVFFLNTTFSTVLTSFNSSTLVQTKLLLILLQNYYNTITV